MTEENRHNELEKFKISVRNLASHNSDFIFDNSNHEHAAIVLNEMLNNSRQEFLIYDDDLSGDIAGKLDGLLYTGLNDFVQRGGILKVVVDQLSEEQNEIHRFILNLRKKFPTKVILKRSSETFRKAVNQVSRDLGFQESEINFATGDDRSFRYEVQKDKRKALCSFNRPNIANELTGAFNTEFETCETLD